MTLSNFGSCLYNFISVLKLILHGDFLDFKDSKKNFSLEIPLCDDIDNTRILIEVKTVGHFTPAFAA